MNILKDTKNDLLKRRELKLVVNADKNPGFAESLKTISKEFKANEENIVVREVKSKFGRDTFLIDAYIYETVQDKNRIEPKKKVKKQAEGGAQ